MDRPLTTADVGCRVAQLGGQLSGGEIARPTVAARPLADIRCLELVAAKQSLGGRLLHGRDTGPGVRIRLTTTPVKAQSACSSSGAETGCSPTRWPARTPAPTCTRCCRPAWPTASTATDTPRRCSLRCPRPGPSRTTRRCCLGALLRPNADQQPALGARARSIDRLRNFDDELKLDDRRIPREVHHREPQAAGPGTIMGRSAHARRVQFDLGKAPTVRPAIRASRPRGTRDCPAKGARRGCSRHDSRPREQQDIATRQPKTCRVQPHAATMLSSRLTRDIAGPISRHRK